MRRKWVTLYKYNRWTHTALGLSVAYMNKSQLIFDENYEYSSFLCKIKGGCDVEGQSIGNIESKGMRYEISIFYNKSAAGMPLPLGYYRGLNLSRFKYNLIQTLDTLGEQNYTNKGWELNYTIGRDYLVGEWITIDVGVEIGARYGVLRYEGELTAVEDYVLRDLYPTQGRLFNLFNEYQWDDPVSPYLFLQLNPFVKIGLLF